MTPPPNDPLPVKTHGGALAPLFVSQDFRWFYRVLVGFLLLVGTAFFSLGLNLLSDGWQHAWSKSQWLPSSIAYTSIGLLILIGALGVYQARRYLSRLQKAAVDQISGIELGKLHEDDFEEVDRVLRLREEKAQKDFERNLKARFVVERLEV